MKTDKTSLVGAAVTLAVLVMTMTGCGRKDNAKNELRTTTLTNGVVVLAQPATVAITQIRRANPNLGRGSEKYDADTQEEDAPVEIVIPSGDEIHDRCVGQIMLNPGTVVAGFDALPYSLRQSPFVPPQIVEALNGWLSDDYGIIMSVNLLEAVGSNRFHIPDNVVVEGPKWSTVCADDEYPDMWFEYRHIGTTSHGIHIVEVAEGGSGSGVFTGLLFLVFERGEMISHSENKVKKENVCTKSVLNLRLVGSWMLGDRYSGVLVFGDDVLTIPDDADWRNNKSHTEYLVFE